MPRFFFDLSDGALTVDDTGTEYPNAHVARDEAIRTLAHMAQEYIGDGQSRAVNVLVRNEEGQALFTASLALTAQWLVETA